MRNVRNARRFARSLFALVVLCAAAVLAPMARADEAQLRAEIAELRAQIAEIRAQMKAIVDQRKSAPGPELPATASASSELTARVDKLEETEAKETVRE